jgi:hypothetical protein
MKYAVPPFGPMKLGDGSGGFGAIEVHAESDTTKNAQVNRIEFLHFLAELDRSLRTLGI